MSRSRLVQRVRRDLGLQPKKQIGYHDTWRLWGKPRNTYYHQFQWRKFEPSKHKRSLLALLLIGLSVAGYVWASDPSNGLFHSIQPAVTVASHNNDPDVVTPIWSPNPGGGTLVSDLFNANGRVGSTYGGGTLWVGSKSVQLMPNSTSNGYAVALSKTSFDPSSVVGKHLRFVYWFQITAGTFPVNDNFVVYFTRNSTLPGTSSYDPRADKSVALAYQFINIGVDGNGFDYQGIVDIQRTTNTRSIMRLRVRVAARRLVFYLRSFSIQTRPMLQHR